MTNNELHLKVFQYLSKVKNTDSLSEEQRQSLQAALDCIEFAFNLDPARALCTGEDDLESIFSRHVDSQVELTLSAEEYKTMGNEMIKQKNYQEAVKFYSNAIRKDPTNHIYYANRAAAYIELEMGEDALKDCNECIRISPDYTKGYSRKGTALILLGRSDEALPCFQHVLDLDPLNEFAQAKVDELESVAKQPKSASSLENLMSSPNISQLLNNPQMMSMASQLFGNLSTSNGNGAGNASPGSNPLANFMNNPELMKMARNFMGGAKKEC